MLQALVRAGILKGMRGPRGGYELARDRRRISAGEIVRAAMASTGEDSEPPVPESELVTRVVEPMVRGAGEVFLAALDEITIDDLCREEEKTSAGEGKNTADFAI